MKKALVLALGMLCSASLAFGQAGVLGTYADELGEQCNVVDDAAGLLTIYVVHTMTQGAFATAYTAVAPLSCMTAATYLSDTAPFPVTIGNSQTGVSIGYGACLAGPISTLGINFFAAGLTQTCCDYSITAFDDPETDPNFIQVVDCGENLIEGSGRINTVNGNPQECDCAAVPVEETSWGQIKAMFN